MKKLKASTKCFLVSTFALGLTVLSPTLLEAEPETKQSKEVYAGDIGMTIMGTIVSPKKSGDNVMLLKLPDQSVSAFRVGLPLALGGTKYQVAFISENELRLESDAELLRVYRDGFSGALLGTAVAETKEEAKAPRAESFSEEGFERKNGSIRVSKGYRDRMIKDELGKILMQASAEPVMVGGNIIGFSIDQIEAGSIYEKSGFQDGDIITEINDIPLNNIGAAIKLLHSLKGASHVAFEYRRGGATLQSEMFIE